MADLGQLAQNIFIMSEKKLKQMVKEVLAELTDELREIIREEMRESIRTKMQKAIKEEFNTVVKEEMRTAFKEDLKKELVPIRTQLIDLLSLKQTVRDVDDLYREKLATQLAI